MKIPFKRIGTALLVGASMAACQTVSTTSGGAVGVDREQRMLVSEQEVEQASAKQYQEVLSAASKESALNRDSAKVQRVRRVADRLIAQTPVFRPDARNWKWEVNVLDSKELNAWCMAGGKIAVYSGLIDRLGLSDDELAAVMGHEIAHALREHVREQVSREMATGLGLSVAGAFLGLGEAGQSLMNTVAKVTFELPYSRLQETEADRIGIELAARAGYNPQAALTLWDKMSKQANGAPPEWLSTHPSSASRRQDLADYAARVMPLYEQARARGR